MYQQQDYQDNSIATPPSTHLTLFMVKQENQHLVVY